VKVYDVHWLHDLKSVLHFVVYVYNVIFMLIMYMIKISLNRNLYLHTVSRKELIWSSKHLLGGRIPYDVSAVCCISFHSELSPLTLYLFSLLLHSVMWFFQILQKTINFIHFTAFFSASCLSHCCTMEII